jgi:hypothetical protein
MLPAEKDNFASLIEDDIWAFPLIKDSDTKEMYEATPC